MKVLTEELARPAHYIVSEANGYRSREQVMIAAGSGLLKAGTVLGINEGEKYVPFDPGGADGSELACAILYEGCDATTEDVRRTITARDTEVQTAVLGWPDGITPAEKTAALASLNARGIVGR